MKFHRGIGLVFRKLESYGFIMINTNFDQVIAYNLALLLSNLALDYHLLKFRI